MPMRRPPNTSIVAQLGSRPRKHSRPRRHSRPKKHGSAGLAADQLDEGLLPRRLRRRLLRRLVQAAVTADIVDAAKKLYRHAFAVLAHPTIKSMTKARDIENEVYVPEPLWKKVKGNSDNVNMNSIVQAVLDSKGYQMQELKTALKKEVSQEMEKNGAKSFKPVIEDIIDCKCTNTFDIP